MLAPVAVAGQAVAYILSVILARRLGVAEFEAYAVAASAFLLMASVAPQGLDNYGMRLLPALIERRDWARAHGFVRLGFRRTLWGALLVGAVVGGLVILAGAIPPYVRAAVLISCLLAPFGALVHLAFESVSAAGREFRAAIVFRIAVPALTLIAFGVISASTVQPTGAIATACWSAGWLTGLIILAIELRRAFPAEVWSTPPVEDRTRWAKEARSFWVYRIALVVMAQTGVIALDLLQPSPIAVGAYAVAMSTVGLASALVSATNRGYARRLAILLERQDFDGVLELRRQRLRWLGPVMIIFLLAIFIWTGPLLAIFRPEFVADGVLTLRILAVATAVAALLALSPTYLKFSRRNRATFVPLACGVAGQLVLMLMLVPSFGATGAATAFAASTIGMYGAFALMARRAFLELRSAGRRS